MGNDVNYLKNGGTLRGTLIDAVPDSPARIQLATGEIATVQWGAIDHIQRASPPSPPRPREPVRRTVDLQPTVMVHVESPSPVEIQRREGRSWKTVCGSPCDQPLPSGGQYRITGDGTKASREFSLVASRNGRADLTVRPASSGWFVFGIVGASVGGATALVAALVGLTASALSADAKTPGNPDGVDGTASSNVATAAWTTAAVGAAVLVVGLVALFQNRHSELTWGTPALDTAAKTVGAPWALTAGLREQHPSSDPYPPRRRHRSLLCTFEDLPLRVAQLGSRKAEFGDHRLHLGPRSDHDDNGIVRRVVALGERVELRLLRRITRLDGPRPIVGGQPQGGLARELPSDRLYRLLDAHRFPARLRSRAFHLVLGQTIPSEDTAIIQKSGKSQPGLLGVDVGP